MNNFSRAGILFVISAPSGTGKSTLCDNLKKTLDFVFSVSCTTRSPREGELEGEDYFYLSKEEFKKRLDEDDFLEYACVHDHYYGTPKRQVIEQLEQGTDVLLDIDVKGAQALRQCKDSFVQNSLVDVFMMPPNIQELEKRLRRRGTEAEEQIQIRLSNAQTEMSCWNEYKYTIISASIEEDLKSFRAIMEAERNLSRRMILK
ncbi:MAG: guanylate kinase [Verrucomicrobiota bacterium]